MNDKITVHTSELERIAFEAIKAKMIDSFGYRPFEDITAKVIESRKPELVALLTDCLDSVLTDQETRTMLVDEFRRKVAKNLIGSLEGSVEKAANAYRSDPTLRARLVMAIESIIKAEESTR